MPMDLPHAETHSLRCSGKRRDAWVVAPNYTGRGTERALCGSSNVDSCTCPVASSFMFLVRAATVSRVFRDAAGMNLLKLEDHHSPRSVDNGPPADSLLERESDSSPWIPNQ